MGGGGAEQQTAFKRLKQTIMHVDMLACYKVGSRTRIIADASLNLCIMSAAFDFS